MTMLTGLARVARDAGLTVVEMPGWKTEGHGQMAEVKTLTFHHDVSPAHDENGALEYIEDKDLSQLTVGRDGTVYVVAAGLCYHAGVVSDESYSNDNNVGVEVAHTGKSGDPWPLVQMVAVVILFAALRKEFGLGIDRVVGHKEIAAPKGRKVDPIDINMGEFRKWVATGAYPGAGATVKPVASKPAPKPAPAAGGSVVDWLAAQGRDSSYAARAKLAAQYGIKGYSGTAPQNTALLAKLKTGTPAAAPVSKPKPAPAKPKGRTVAQMAAEVIAGKHGSGHPNRRESLGVSAAVYEQVRAEVNKRAGIKTTPKGKSVTQMATEVIQGKHGNGHPARQKSLGVNNATYAKVRAEVNRRA